MGHENPVLPESSDSVTRRLAIVATVAAVLVPIALPAPSEKWRRKIRVALTIKQQFPEVSIDDRGEVDVSVWITASERSKMEQLGWIRNGKIRPKFVLGEASGDRTVIAPLS